MVIQLRFFAELKKYAPASSSGILTVDVEDHIKVNELLEELAITAQEVGIVKINGAVGSIMQTLADGDHVDVIPYNGR